MEIYSLKFPERHKRRQSKSWRGLYCSVCIYYKWMLKFQEHKQWEAGKCAYMRTVFELTFLGHLEHGTRLLSM